MEGMYLEVGGGRRNTSNNLQNTHSWLQPSSYIKHLYPGKSKRITPLAGFSTIRKQRSKSCLSHIPNIGEKLLATARWLDNWQVASTLQSLMPTLGA